MKGFKKFGLIKDKKDYLERRGGASRMDPAICVNCCIPDDVSLYFHRR